MLKSATEHSVVADCDSDGAEAAAPDAPHPMAEELCRELDTIAAGVRASASELGMAFIQPDPQSGAPVGLTESLGAMVSEVRPSEGSELATGAARAIDGMVENAERTERLLTEALDAVVAVDIGIQCVRARTLGLRRLAAVNRFLATYANMEDAHADKQLGLGFGIAGVRINKLVDENLETCDRLDDACAKLGSRTAALTGAIHIILRRLREYQTSLYDARRKSRVFLGTYEAVLQQQMGELARRGEAVALGIGSLQRALQYEDMVTQLVAAIERRLRGEEQGQSSNRPVLQTSMDAGTVELF